jgi:Protein of unknown function (DUF3574)
MRPGRLSLPVLLVLLLAAASPAALALTSETVCEGEAFPLARLELYFGTQKPGGAPVTEAEWHAFMEEEVTPRFPDGLTVLRGYGQWRNAAGVITRETSAVLIILYEPSAEKEAGIEDIRAAYKDRFAQESVMRVDGPTQCVSF